MPHQRTSTANARWWLSRRRKEATLRAANRLSVLGLAFLAFAMIGAIFLIMDLLFGAVATVATVAIGAVCA
jgi:hypothetical protein